MKLYCPQGAVQESCSSLHTAWLIREIIAENVDKGKTVYIGLLDIKKAYDTVWHNGLFYQLYNIGINGKTWRIIRNLYHDFNCKIRVAGIYSVEFKALQGIHQGAPCSYFLHAVFNNPFIQDVKRSIVGAKACGEILSCPSFADDVSVITFSREGLQILFDIAYKFSTKWRFQYSPTKCKVVVVGKDTNPKLQVKMGNNTIDISNCETHLGVPLTGDSKQQETLSL